MGGAFCCEKPLVQLALCVYWQKKTSRAVGLVGPSRRGLFLSGSAVMSCLSIKHLKSAPCLPRSTPCVFGLTDRVVHFQPCCMTSVDWAGSPTAHRKVSAITSSTPAWTSAGNMQGHPVPFGERTAQSCQFLPVTMTAALLCNNITTTFEAQPVATSAHCLQQIATDLSHIRQKSFTCRPYQRPRNLNRDGQACCR